LVFEPACTLAPSAL